MSIDVFAFSVPVFVQGLNALSNILRTAEKHATERKIEPSALLSARLFPDMFALTRQVQIACDTAKRTVARLAGVEAPRHEDNEATFAELQERIAKTLAFIETQSADAFRDAGNRVIELKLGADTHNFTGKDFLARFGLPNFYFHLVTAYDILRHNGVAVGKFDYLGKVVA